MFNKLDLGRLAALARTQKRVLSIGLVFLLIGAGMQLTYPKVLQMMVDGVASGGGRAVVNETVALLLLLFAISGVAGGLRSYLFTVAGEQVVAQLRKDLFSALIHQEIAFFDAERTGELTNRLASDTTVVQNAVTVNVSMALRFGIMAIGSVVILFLTSWKLTLMMLAVVPVIAVGLSIYGRSLRDVSRQVQDALAAATAVAEETLSGVRTVRSFAREDGEVERYGTAVARTFDLARRRAKLGAIFAGSMGFLGFGGIGAVLWYGGVLLVEGQMSAGELTSFLVYTMVMAGSVGALSGLWEDLMKAIGASERVFALMDRQPQVSSGERRLPTISGHVSLRDVHFAYPARPDAPVLRGLDLELRPGEVVALVGPSGGGKSTVAALLSRFYDPQQGALSLDGIDYRELEPNWLREQVGVVSQEPILFATSIEDNIRYARPTATRAEVEAAARAANAHDFISAFPEGYATLVGERGVRLSGGQKQRVAIARALLKDPRLLILDEATSALDAESEHLVQEALDRLMEGRTTLVIAHRLSTVKAADRVAVIDDGHVVEQGTHPELLTHDGLYKRLVERQFAR